MDRTQVSTSQLERLFVKSVEGYTTKTPLPESFSVVSDKRIIVNDSWLFEVLLSISGITELYSRGKYLFFNYVLDPEEHIQIHLCFPNFSSANSKFTKKYEVRNLPSESKG